MIGKGESGNASKALHIGGSGSKGIGNAVAKVHVLVPDAFVIAHVFRLAEGTDIGKPRIGQIGHQFKVNSFGVICWGNLKFLVTAGESFRPPQGRLSLLSHYIENGID